MTGEVAAQLACHSAIKGRRGGVVLVNTSAKMGMQFETREGFEANAGARAEIETAWRLRLKANSAATPFP